LNQDHIFHLPLELSSHYTKLLHLYPRIKVLPKNHSPLSYPKLLSSLLSLVIHPKSVLQKMVCINVLLPHPLFVLASLNILLPLPTLVLLLPYKLQHFQHLVLQNSQTIYISFQLIDVPYPSLIVLRLEVPYISYLMLLHIGRIHLVLVQFLFDVD